MSTILLTGTTGNLGSRTLIELLEETDNLFILPVYATCETEAKKQVISVLKFWNRDFDNYKERILIVASDLTKSDLGLTTDIYKEVAKRTTHVIHCAANFKLDLSLAEARNSIVGATKNIVTLIKSSGTPETFKRFNYISSLDAAGAKNGIIPETFVLTSQKTFLNTYQQAKSEAEDYLYYLYQEEKFPITVYRPSMLVGDSQTGKIINAQSLYHIINDMFLAPASTILPGKDFHIDPIPINIVAHALKHMYDAPETNGRVYNLVSGHDKSLSLPNFVRQLQIIYKDLEHKLRPIPHFISPHLPYVILSIASLFAFGRLKKELNQQKNMVRYFFLDMRPENKISSDFLAQKNIAIPPLSSYLPILCKHIFTEQKAPASLHTK